MTELITSLSAAITHANKNNIEIPLELLRRAHAVGALKASGDMASVNAVYHDKITTSLTAYFEGGSLAGSRNAFKRAMVESFGAAFDLGWVDGGQELPADSEALLWFNARVDTEFGFIDQLFIQAKELKKEDGFDYFAWITARADGYTRSVNDVYNMAGLWASKNKMLTFAGEDGDADNICQKNNGTCVRLKGQRHRASWWLSHDLVPYRGNKNYDCGAWECRHYLQDDKGVRFTL